MVDVNVQQTVNSNGDVECKAERNEVLTIKEGINERSNRSLFTMVSFGLIISGLMESAVLPRTDTDVATAAVVVSNLLNNVSRRYCDPPNMTVMAIYYDSEEENTQFDYDFSQMEEIDFKVEFSSTEQAGQLLWQVFLCGSLLGPPISSWSVVKFGPGRVFGFCILVSSVIGMFATIAGFTARIIIVCLQGVIQGQIVPSCILLGLISIPEGRLTSFLALIAGIRAGSALGEMLPDQILPFITCIVAVIWFSAWVLIFNTPFMLQQKQPIPWRKMMSSHSIWMSTIAVVGGEMVLSAVAYTLRQYLYLVYNFTVKYLLTAPMVGHFIFSLICGLIGNTIESSQIVTRTVSRKLFIYTSHFLPSGALFISCFVGCVDSGPAALYAIAAVLSGAVYSGAYASMLDIAPNFGATIVPLICTFGCTARLTPVLLTALVTDGYMPGSWRTVMSVSSLVALLTAMLFMLRANSRHQPWNSPEFQNSRRSTARLNIEEKILKVLMVQERDPTLRARAYSTSFATRQHFVRPKRASIS